MELSVPTTELPVDAIVGDRYRVVRKIGEGGMSVVYEVQHIKLLRSFALKALLPELLRNQEAVERFAREAELLGSLRHKNVVGISDWISLPDGSPAMILEFLHGASLQVRLLRAPLSWDAIARIGDQTMSALSLSHRIGITHRDLKPENIFISIDDSGDEQAKLLDFGISKLRGVGRLSGVHKMLGTPSYMSPEQVTGNTDLIGPSTDVWAMGAILYEMATQQVAFKGQDVMQTLELITEGRPPPLANLRADAPPEFIELVDRAISREPERRTQTIEELRDQLRDALPRDRTQALPSPRLTPKPNSTSGPVAPTPTSTPAPPGLGVISFPTKPPPPTVTQLEVK
ncbi:MAG TPA: serine/threonine-protein kinase, partial [Kofleriaceae bacterium]|nr:serine/threonine-protein kinase [Kofleriaceae bacterium]